MTAYGFAGLLVLVAIVAAPTWHHIHQVRRLSGVRVSTGLTAEDVSAVYFAAVCGGFRSHTWRTEKKRVGFDDARVELRSTNTAWRSAVPPDVMLSIHAGDHRSPTTCFLRTGHRPTGGNASKVSRLLRSFRKFERAVRAADPAAEVVRLR